MASGSIISDLPFLPSELILNILKRLPVKSILRFRCVCKEWKTLFKTQSFIYDNYRSNPLHNNPFLLHQRMNDLPYLLSLLNHNMEISEPLHIPISLRNSWKIVGSCNGLICIRDNGDCRTSSSIGVWNPVIREVRKIPLTSIDCGGSCGYGFGFGYSSIVNDYKIVRFYNQAWRKMEEDQFDYNGVEVFSLRTGLWKELEFRFGNFGMFRRFTSSPVNIDETIYWFKKWDTSYMIVSFNVATEVFTLTPIAVSTFEPIERVSPIGLGVYDNKLEVHAISIELHGLLSISVCVMEEVTSESGKLLRFDPVKKYKFGPMAGRLFPVFIWKHELACINARLGGGLTLFNLITNERRDFNDLSVDSGVCNYEMSLVSVWNNN